MARFSRPLLQRISRDTAKVINGWAKPALLFQIGV